MTMNLAFLGCGFATRLHSRTLKGRAVRRFYASRSRERAEEYAARYGGAGAYGSYEEAIGDPAIDAVLVATPPASHLTLTLSSLEAGKHVIVEKPPFLRSSDFAEVERVAAAAGRRVFVAENYFYKPLLSRLRQLLADREIGDVRIIAVNALKEQKTENWRDDVALAGGGALYEGGIHWVNFMASLGLSVADVQGYLPGATEGLEKTVLAVFRYAEGPVGTLMYSWEIGSPTKGLRLSTIYGTDGAITFESNGLFLAVRGRRKRLAVPRPSDLLGYGAMFDDFLGSIREGRAPEFDLPQARRDLELVERIYASAAGTTAG
jgi:UDP-N-acetylglucosamine 3-dehydrogenase